MTKTNLTILLSSLIILAFTSCSTNEVQHPNIILILADDMGYAEAGSYGQKYIKTPSIDRLAENGVKFTQFYSGSPVCAPSRCVLMTGMHSGHSYIRNNGEQKGVEQRWPFPGQNPIPDSVLTIAEVLKDQGYATACFGKWGLGHTGNSGDPANQGFDLFYGFKCQRHAHNHYPNFLWRNDKMEELSGNTRTLYGDQHSQDLFIGEAISFIENNRENPFFLYLPFIIPHLSIQTTDTFLSMYKGSLPEEEYVHRGYIEHPYPRAGYAGMITQMDYGIGQIMDRIEELGLNEETIIIFTSDNGPTFDRLGGSDSDFFESSVPMRGRKGRLLEGGIRVPLVIQWQGKIEPSTECNLPSAFQDIFPSLCEVSGTSAPGFIDGTTLMDAILNTGAELPPYDRSLYWEFPNYGGQAAMRKGDWKLLIEDLKTKDAPFRLSLYNLRDDIPESENLAEQYPGIVSDILQEMQNSRTSSELFPFTELEQFYSIQLKSAE